jgi:uncharacterized protein
VKLYLDSSVLVAALTPELLNPRALAVLGSASSVVVSELTITETRISLIRKRKRGAMTAIEVAESMQELSTALQDGTFSVEALTVSAHRAAESLADRVPVAVRAMDALHIAMVAQIGAELATFDKDQALAARADGLTVHDETA